MNKRMMALAIDFIIYILICHILLNNYKDIDLIYFPKKVYLIITLCAILPLFKDITFKNASVGKKIMNIEIKKQNKKPHLIIVIMRNITILVAAIEIILTIVKSKRFGDIIFNTEVVKGN